MKIYADTPEKKEFYQKLQNAKWDAKPIEKFDMTLDGKVSSQHISRVEYLYPSFKEVNIKVPRVKFINYFETMENRYLINKYVILPKLREVCISKKLSAAEIREFWDGKKDQFEMTHETIIFAEYFVFSVKSCLDIMSQILNKVYNLGVKETKTDIMNIFEKMVQIAPDDPMTKCLQKHMIEWIQEFNTLRKKMTHHQIINFSQNTNYNPETKSGEYRSHSISVTIDEFSKLQKNLPEYFEDISKSFDELAKDFYTNLKKMSFNDPSIENHSRRNKQLNENQKSPE